MFFEGNGEGYLREVSEFLILKFRAFKKRGRITEITAVS